MSWVPVEDCANHAHREDRALDAHLPVRLGVEDTNPFDLAHLEVLVPLRRMA